MIALICILLAAVCKATADTLAHHFDTSIFKKKRRSFWDPAVSSTQAPRVFNYKIDAWHLFNSGMIVFFIAAAALHPFDRDRLQWFLEIPCAGLCFIVMFNTFYNKILR